MTTTTFDPGATHAPINLVKLLVALVAAAALVVAAFVVGRVTADDSDPRPATSSAEAPAPAASGDLDLGQPVERCLVGQAC